MSFDAWFFGVSHKVLLFFLCAIAYLILPKAVFVISAKQKMGSTC